MQPLTEKFEALSMGGGLGPDPHGIDLAALPRPTGEQKAAALNPAEPSHPTNCSLDNMRLTVQAMPNSSALRARWVLKVAAGGARECTLRWVLVGALKLQFAVGAERWVLKGASEGD
eukprot:1155704-Pelagomonas_calceolata.AAC.3